MSFDLTILSDLLLTIPFMVGYTNMSAFSRALLKKDVWSEQNREMLARQKFEKLWMEQLDKDGLQNMAASILGGFFGFWAGGPGGAKKGWDTANYMSRLENFRNEGFDATKYLEENYDLLGGAGKFYTGQDQQIYDKMLYDTKKYKEAKQLEMGLDLMQTMFVWPKTEKLEGTELEEFKDAPWFDWGKSDVDSKFSYIFKDKNMKDILGQAYNVKNKLLAGKPLMSVSLSDLGDIIKGPEDTPFFPTPTGEESKSIFEEFPDFYEETISEMVEDESSILSAEVAEPSLDEILNDWDDYGDAGEAPIISGVDETPFVESIDETTTDIFDIPDSNLDGIIDDTDILNNFVPDLNVPIEDDLRLQQLGIKHPDLIAKIKMLEEQGLYNENIRINPRGQLYCTNCTQADQDIIQGLQSLHGGYLDENAKLDLCLKNPLLPICSQYKGQIEEINRQDDQNKLRNLESLDEKAGADLGGDNAEAIAALADMPTNLFPNPNLTAPETIGVEPGFTPIQLDDINYNPEALADADMNNNGVIDEGELELLNTLNEIELERISTDEEYQVRTALREQKFAEIQEDMQERRITEETEASKSLDKVAEGGAQSQYTVVEPTEEERIESLEQTIEGRRQLKEEKFDTEYSAVGGRINTIRSKTLDRNLFHLKKMADDPNSFIMDLVDVSKEELMDIVELIDAGGDLSLIPPEILELLVTSKFKYKNGQLFIDQDARVSDFTFDPVGKRGRAIPGIYIGGGY